MNYTKARFNELYKEFLEKESELLNLKRDEYVPDGEEDCIENFRIAASFEGRRPEEVCMTYLMKHLQSIQRAVTTEKYDFAWWSEGQGVEGTKQRIADSRNLLMLLAAIMDDKETN